MVGAGDAPAVDARGAVDAGVDLALESVERGASAVDVERVAGLGSGWRDAVGVVLVGGDGDADARLGLDAALEAVASGLPPLAGVPAGEGAAGVTGETLRESVGAYVRGRDLILRGDSAGAVVELERAVALDGGAAAAWRELGRARLSLSDLSGARAALVRAVGLDPSDALAWEGLALASSARRESDMAAWAFARLLQLGPSEPAMVILAEAGLGENLLRLGYLRAGTDALAAAVERGPGDGVPSIRSERLSQFLAQRARTMVAVGGIRLGLGDGAGAVRAYRLAAALGGGEADTSRARLGLAAVLASAGEDEAACRVVIGALADGAPMTGELIEDVLVSLAVSDVSARRLSGLIDGVLGTGGGAGVGAGVGERLELARLAVLPSVDAARMLVGRLIEDPESVGDAALLAAALSDVSPSAGLAILSGLRGRGHVAFEPVAFALSAGDAVEGYVSAARAVVDGWVSGAVDVEGSDGLGLLAASLSVLRVREPAPLLLGDVDVLGDVVLADASVLRIAGAIALDAGEPGLVDGWVGRVMADWGSGDVGGAAGGMDVAIGAMLMRRGRVSEGVSWLGARMGDGDASDRLELGYARALSQAGADEAAAAVFGSMLDREAGNRAALTGLLEIGQRDAAALGGREPRALVSTLFTRHGDSFEGRFLRAQLLGAEGRAGEGVALLGSLASSPAAPSGVHEQLSRSERALGAAGRSVERLERLRAARPVDGDAARLLAEAYRAEGRDGEADGVYRSGLAAQPGNASLSVSAERFYRDVHGDAAFADALRLARLKRAWPTRANTIEYIAAIVEGGGVVDAGAVGTRVGVAADEPGAGELAARASELVQWLCGTAVQSEDADRAWALASIARAITDSWDGVGEQALFLAVGTQTRLASPEPVHATTRRIAAAVSGRGDGAVAGCVQASAQAILSVAGISAGEARAAAASGAAIDRDVIERAMGVLAWGARHSGTRGAEVAVAWIGLADTWGMFEASGVVGAVRWLVENDRLAVALDSFGQRQATTGVEADVRLAAASTAQYLGGVVDRSGDLDLAVAVWEAGLEFMPENADVLNSLAFRLLEAGRSIDEAAGYAERAVERRPDAAHIVDTLAYARLRQGRLEDSGAEAGALSLFGRALALAAEEGEDGVSTVAFVQLHLGDALWAADRREDAATAWRAAEAAGERFLEAVEADPALSIPVWNRSAFDELLAGVRARLEAVASGAAPGVIEPILAADRVGGGE